MKVRLVIDGSCDNPLADRRHVYEVTLGRTVRVKAGCIADAERTAAATLGPVRRLTCCCCGEVTRGRQWHNRDTGYGLCPKCADWIIGRDNMSPEEFTSCYGVRGVHFDAEAGVRSE
jgi:hypothetical protein